MRQSCLLLSSIALPAVDLRHFYISKYPFRLFSCLTLTRLQSGSLFLKVSICSFLGDRLLLLRGGPLRSEVARIERVPLRAQLSGRPG